MTLATKHKQNIMLINNNDYITGWQKINEILQYLKTQDISFHILMQYNLFFYLFSLATNATCFSTATYEWFSYDLPHENHIIVYYTSKSNVKTIRSHGDIIIKLKGDRYKKLHKYK